MTTAFVAALYAKPRAAKARRRVRPSPAMRRDPRNGCALRSSTHRSDRVAGACDRARRCDAGPATTPLSSAVCDRHLVGLRIDYRRRLDSRRAVPRSPVRAQTASVARYMRPVTRQPAMPASCMRATLTGRASRGRDRVRQRAVEIEGNQSINRLSACARSARDAATRRRSASAANARGIVAIRSSAVLHDAEGAGEVAERKARGETCRAGGRHDGD